MERCIKCIMPKKAEGLTFDGNGLCFLCQTYKPSVQLGKGRLIKDITPYLVKGKEYDCVVPVSGGRDSAYALYYAKEILGLSPLAVHNDNDFETDIAHTNLANITHNLRVKLVRTSSSKNHSRRIVAEKFKMNAPFGTALVLEQTCEACKYGFESAAYNTARREGIKIIFWGDSVDESTQKYYGLVAHHRPSKWQRLLSPGVVNVFKYKYYFKKLKIEYGANSLDGLKEIHLYDYIEWDRKVIVDTIQTKLGWSKPENSATSWRIDCPLVPLVNYLTLKAHGVSKIELGFSNMVRSGKMDRDEALKQIQEIEKDTNIVELHQFLEKIGVSTSAIRKVL